MDIRLPQDQPWRLSARGQRWFDRTLVGVLFLPAPLFPLDGGPWSWALLGTAHSIPLLWRRSHPVAVFTVIALTCLVQAIVIDTPIWSQVAVPIATYSVARYSTALWSAVAVAIGILGAFIAAYIWLHEYAEEISGTAYVSYVLTIATIVVAAWALGTLARTRKAYVDSLVDRGKQIEREAQQQVALAASAERARIAREMHDVVAHGLTTMVVQADGARYAAAQHPEVAAETLENISETGREALTEMRRLLGVLREGGDATGTAPQPRLGDIGALVDDPRVEAALTGLDRPVPDGVALTAYRVVQEALNNVRKHAGPVARATVAVTVSDAVEITVDDDGRGAAATSDGRGLGLVGMRERVLAHDGELDAGPRPSGGFRVRARIPL